MSKEAIKETTKEMPESFAVVEVSGIQLKVVEGKKYDVDHISVEKGEKVVLDKVLLVSDGKDVKVGKPYVEGAKVETVVDAQKKDKKVDTLIYKAKSRQRTQSGHRALITRLLIKKISA
jgi:large subunit ribosomal protein L21